MPLAHRIRIQNNVNTDYIISGKYKFKIQDEKDMGKYLFAEIEDGFCDRIKEGDFLISGNNFGCGSSREQAPAALKASGIKAVIAKSFARIFYRNAFNIGLCLIECETNYIDDMDELELDLEKNVLYNLSKGVNLGIKPVPYIMRVFLKKGGVVEYFKEKGGFKALENIGQE
jgi:3-isopropylmalate/(R)-2-methylmalate dehydratase small subunit